MQSITFNCGERKFVVEPTKFGFSLYYDGVVCKDYIFCIGDYNGGCVFMKKKEKDKFDLTYCSPFQVFKEPEYTSKKWRNAAETFTLKKRTVNGRTLYAKPFFDGSSATGVYFLSQDDGSEEIRQVLHLVSGPKKDGKTLISVHITSRIVNP